MIENEKILCVTMSDWDGPKYGRHHLMNTIAEKNRVIWLEVPISVKEFSLHKIPRFFKFLRPPRQIKKNLLILTPPPSIPFVDRLPLLNMLNSFILYLWLKSRLRALGFSPTIFWAFFCLTPYLVGKFGESISLYYCNDPFFDTKLMTEREKELCQKVDLVITNHEPLTNGKKAYNSNCYTVWHGVDTRNFCPNELHIPEDIKHLKKPIIGYVGTIKVYLDFDLIIYLAKQHPNWSILLVGPVTKMPAKQYKNFNRLSSQKNIFILGGRDINSIPHYIHALDVALFPYDVEKCKKYKKGLYWQVPLKFFEYLIMGKPIVSTDYTDYEGIPVDFYELASSPQGFLQRIERCLEDDSPAKQSQRIAFAKQNSWQHRIEQIAGYISATRAKKILHP